jgi:hypothetical protein
MNLGSLSQVKVSGVVTAERKLVAVLKAGQVQPCVLNIDSGGRVRARVSVDRRVRRLTDDEVLERLA